MKIKVIVPFRDKEDYSVLYEEGKVYEFGDERAKGIIDLKLAVEYKEEKAEEKPVEKKAAPKRKKVADK